MIGKYRIVLKDRFVRYDFEVSRKFTILNDLSSTGKTTLYKMVEQFNARGNDSGISMSCKVPFKPLYDLSSISDNHIYIVDEYFKGFGSDDFASALQKSDSYFILITRRKLSNIPYSISEIYTLDSTKKYNNINKEYTLTTFKGRYADNVTSVKPSVILVEDSNSGYEFFKNYAESRDISCISANGKSKIKKCLSKLRNEVVYIIADGAAFGSEVKDVLKAMSTMDNVYLFTPESFEYLILISDVVDVNFDCLIRTFDFCDARKFNSWEQYYTSLLKEVTYNTFKHYDKASLNPYYLKCMNKILRGIPDLI